MDKVVAKAAIFDGVESECLAAVRSQLHRVKFAAREVVFAQGEPGDRLYIIKSGTVKVAQCCADGREHLLAILGPSEMFGELSVFDPGPRTCSAIAITAMSAVWMDRDALRAWMTAHPQIGGQLLGVLARRMRRTNDTVAGHVFTDMPGRVAKQLLLLLLAQQFDLRESGGAASIVRDVSPLEIAQLAGASPEAAHKALHDFAARGWIQLETDAVVIVDPARLVMRSRGD